MDYVPLSQLLMNDVPNTIPYSEVLANDNVDSAIHVPYDHMVHAEDQVTSENESPDSVKQLRICALYDVIS